MHVNPTDRRRGTRVGADFLMNVAVAGDLFVGRATDLSMSGVGFLLPRARRREVAGASVAVQFSMPWSREVGYAVGRVTRQRDCDSHDGRDGTALRWSRVSPCTRRVMERYVAAQRCEEAPYSKWRSSARVSFMDLVTIVRGGRPLLARGLDLSADGLRCIAMREPHVPPPFRGQMVEALLRLPGTGRPVVLPARVRWAVITPRNLRGVTPTEEYALRFEDAPGGARALLEGYLARRAVGQ